ncbi:MAG: superoxide dismutase family protein [Winogradskyella sp.]|uniref:superoxide dismutase family protein n=1 Tax=Winogradskyella sp. TaxID=1883156 RepID=UPI0017D4FC0C|nr:superoxide dismutase family protein [Winogradskyella sp.]MBT8243781.1 superoxide dismutase family protein [Winogradskyella sp.]NNK22027.1 superoxide dismutase family protein [Winogradskyella sp.]
MKNFKLITFLFSLVFIVGCKDNKKTEEVIEDIEIEEVVEGTEKKMDMTITLSPKSESTVKGTVTFSQADGKVSMVANMTGLTEGKHAIHIHQTADCSSADGKSAGGHWNPTNEPHGKWGDETGYHKGDIGNFDVAADGVGKVEFSTDEWCIGCGDKNKDILGKAIIVHQGTDDFTSQPSGAAGARVSCAGIIE